nr:hypothetical protein K-LCC10_0181 [Kaumoebavirus]
MEFKLEKKILGGIRVEMAEGDTIEEAKLLIGGVIYRAKIVGDQLNFFTPPHRFPHDPVWIPFNLICYWDIELVLRGNFSREPNVIPQYYPVQLQLPINDFKIPVHCAWDYDHRISWKLREEGYNNLFYFNNGYGCMVYVS